MKEKSKHFCIVPFVHFSCKPDGRARLCCFSPNSYVLDKSGHPSYLGRTPLKEIWHSDWMNALRKRMLAENPLPECQHCYQEELAGKTSKRQRENNRYAKKAEHIVTHALLNEGSIGSADPMHFDLRLGNFCNLKCRTCNPVFSSSWVREVENNPNSVSHQSYRDLLEQARQSEHWHRNPIFWEQFYLIASSVEEMYLTGGEPMLIKEHFTLLKYFVDNGHASRIKLRYNTNVTLLPTEFLNLVPYFKEVFLSCSIDGLFEQNDWLRFPSKWDMIAKNFEKIVQLPDNVRIDINCTISVFNIFYFDDIIRYFKNISKTHARDFEVSADLLHEPHFMRLELLPENLKKVTIQKIVDAHDTISNLTALEKQSLIALTKLIEAKNPQEKELKLELKQHIRDLDQIRKEDFASVFPDLIELTQ